MGVGLAGLLLALPLPQGLTPHGMRALALVVLAFVFFGTEPIPLPGVSLLIAILEVLFGLGNPTEVAQSFFNDSVFFIMGSLMIATALIRHNLDKRIGGLIIQWTGSEVKRLVFGLMTASALIASFIGEHTAATLMLPIAASLVHASGEEQHRLKNLSALLMLSIAYGAMISGVGTPSGGARNAIILAYWRELFHLNISYWQWMIYVYPMIFIQVPLVAFILCNTLRPEKSNLSEAVLKLKKRVQEEGPMKAREWLVVGILGVTVLLWIVFGDRLGLGTIALIGVLLFLFTGTITWDELNNNVNWGVILIYSGTLSLGFVMKNTGAAEWVAQHFLNYLRPLGMGKGIPFLFAVSLLTATVTSILTTGATVGILGPIVLNMAMLSGSSVIAAGLTTAISSAFSYMTFFSSPVGNIIVGSGFLSNSYFVKAGWKVWILSIIVLMILASTYWRLLGIVSG